MTIRDLIRALDAGSCPTPSEAEKIGIRLRGAVASGSHCLLTPDECRVLMEGLEAAQKILKGGRP